MPLPLGFVMDSGGFEWLDLAVPFTVVFLYLVLCYFFPRPFLRPLWWLITRFHYRMRVFDAAKFPKNGGILIVSNHLSYVDWMLIWMACPRRVQFIAAASHSKNPFLKFCLKVVGTIPIDGKSGPKALIESMKRIAERLDRGEVICVFPEGKLSRTGNMARFSRGLEKILGFTQTAVPIVPVNLWGMWGSIFSYRYGKLFFKWPERLRRRTAVVWGDPLPKETKAEEVRLKIQHLSAKAGIEQSDFLLPVHREFVRKGARFRQMFRAAFVDTAGLKPQKVSYLKAIVGAMVIRKWLKPQIGEEQNVGVWLPASVGSALTNISLAMLGRTSVNLNYTSGSEAVKSAARQTGMKTVITSKRFLEKVPLDLGDGIKLIDLEEAKAGISKFQRLRTLIAVFLLPGWFLDRFVLRLTGTKLDDPITIIFSSGSTGEPKGVVLSHRNIAGNADSMITQILLSKADRVLGILPLFHSFGFTVTFWTPLLIGASSVFHADPRQAKKVGELCRTQGCTIFLGTATFLRLYLRGCQPEDFKTLRLIVCGAEKLPPGLAKEFNDKFGVYPFEGYGCTELSPVVSTNVHDVTIKGITQTANKVGTIGHPTPGIAGKIVEPETMKELPVGKEGLLLVKGPNVMLGYLNKPEMTRSVVIDGWYVTGDMGFIDEDGFTTLTGRLSRFAKIGGEMIPLEKVEQDLHDVLNTGDRVLAVSSVPDEKRGERLIVLHLPTLTVPPGELLKKVGERGLPNLWIPGERDFFLIDEMPVLGTGKIDLRRLKELAVEKARK